MSIESHIQDALRAIRAIEQHIEEDVNILHSSLDLIVARICNAKDNISNKVIASPQPAADMISVSELLDAIKQLTDS